MESLPVSQLAVVLGCSEMTVRRDLDVLERDGVLRRERGGAVASTLRGDEVPYALRVFEATEAKERIARAVAALIADGEPWSSTAAPLLPKWVGHCGGDQSR